jgi:hypothetical protein
MLTVLPEPAATVVATATFTGARKGEIRGFLWENYDGFEIRVTTSVWRSHVDEPKRPKSKAAIPVVAQLKTLLERHRAACGNPSRGFIFASATGRPMNLDALAKRCHPTRADQSGLGMARLARFSAGACYQSPPAWRIRQSDPANPTSR